MRHADAASPSPAGERTTFWALGWKSHLSPGSSGLLGALGFRRVLLGFRRGQVPI